MTKPTTIRRATVRRSRLLQVGTGAAAAVLAVSVAAAGSAFAAARPTKRKAPTKQALVVGNIVDLTGNNGSQGSVDNDNGIAAWVKVMNARGGLDGHKVSVSTCDAASSVTGAQTCAEKMTNVGDVLLSVVPGEIAAALPILQSEGKVAFTQTPIENPASGSNLFQLVPPLATYVTAFLAPGKKQGITTVGAVVTDDASGIGITKALQAAAAPLGMTVDVEQMADGSTSATVQVEQLEADHVGMIFDGGVGANGIIILSSIKALGLDNIPVGIEAGNVENIFLAAARSSIPGQIYGAPPSLFVFPSTLSGRAAKAAQAFEAAYKRVTGQHLDTNTDTVFGAGLINSAAQLLADVGAKPSLSTAEGYLHSHVIGGIQQLRYSATGTQDNYNVPIGLLETKANGHWTTCQKGGPLHC